MKKKKLIGVSVVSLLLLSCTEVDEFKSPDIFVLGDSQILFGSGETYLAFFESITNECMSVNSNDDHLEALQSPAVGVLGVRATSLTSWVGKDEEAKKRICTIDPTWPINATTLGVINRSDEDFFQAGKEEPFRFCEKGKSAFEVMFEAPHYRPKLFVMSFLGNSARRWADNADDAEKDAIASMEQIPQDMPCILMTTAPTYREKSVALRLKAQQNFKAAFEKSGSTCSFIEGLTPQTIKANLGNNLHFKSDETGKVKDPFHPNEKGAEKFFSLKRQDICRAVVEQFSTKLFSAKAQ